MTENQTQTDGGDGEQTHYCDDCDCRLELLYDERPDETIPVVCGECGGKNTRQIAEGSA